MKLILSSPRRWIALLLFAGSLSGHALPVSAHALPVKVNQEPALQIIGTCEAELAGCMNGGGDSDACWNAYWRCISQ